MSLIAYGGSDDSESEETSTSAAPESRVGTGGLFSLLPAPKKKGPAGGDYGPIKETKTNPSAGNSTSSDDLDPQPSKGGLFSSLPKLKKRTEPVKITVPQIQRRDSDSDDDEPAKKKLKPQGKRNRGKKEMKFLEIKGEDQLSGNQQWMTKSMTEEKQTRQSLGKVAMFE